MLHWILEYYQDCSNNDLGLTLAYVTTRSNMEKILEHKVSSKIFAQKCSNDELGLILICLLQD